MKTMKNKAKYVALVLSLVLLLNSPVMAFNNYTYAKEVLTEDIDLEESDTLNIYNTDFEYDETSDNTIIIRKYIGSYNGDVIIPREIDGKLVEKIGVDESIFSSGAIIEVI